MERVDKVEGKRGKGKQATAFHSTKITCQQVRETYHVPILLSESEWSLLLELAGIIEQTELSVERCKLHPLQRCLKARVPTVSGRRYIKCNAISISDFVLYCSWVRIKHTSTIW